jgi:hypothetical protein
MACPVLAGMEGVARTWIGGRAAASKAASNDVSNIGVCGVRWSCSHVQADRASCFMKCFPDET